MRRRKNFVPKRRQREGRPMRRMVLLLFGGGSLPPVTADPPLPAGSPPSDVAPPLPSTHADAASEGQHASTEVMPTTGVKRAHEGVSGPSAAPLRVTRRRTEGAPMEIQAGSGEPVVVRDQAAELGSEEGGGDPRWMPIRPGRMRRE
ncbi:unnamed protein product [Cochlearia groenlandica]